MTSPALNVSFGVSLSNRAVVIGKVRAIEIVEVAKMAEDSGEFDSAWVGDSIIAKPRLESVVALSAIATRTERIKLGTACLATFVMRNPLLFAHQWASLDAMSEGRTLLAVCLGGHGPQELVEREFTTMGVPLKERVPRMLEGMEICRRLWAEDRVTHRGRFYQFENVTIGPKPVQRPCPIWIANNPTDPAVMGKAHRRVAHHADGWMTGSLPPKAFEERWEWVKGLRREEKGTDAGFHSALHLRSNVNNDREAAFKEAKEFLDAYYSVDHKRQHLEEDCVIGTPEECIEKFVAYARGGCNIIMVRLVSWKPKVQLERWITQVIPEVWKRLGPGARAHK
jgi:alkanesulfonate monooxygenase SsuD/methylene tetrahydromethanopterin reductase-like flavin-dependent oxidoreductase (luciferase family)